ncbi:MAG: radical SAM protein [Candidatus Lokiarchaeota archaeon]
MTENTKLVSFHDSFDLSLEKPLSHSEMYPLLNKLKMGTREWAKRELNCIKGCYNNCIYCYAKAIAKQFKRCDEDTWEKMKISERIINKDYGKTRKKGPQPYDIMFPTSHDIFPQEPYYSAYLKVLKKLIKAGNSVLIVSKPREEVIRDLCEELKGYEDNVAFRFTIGSTNSELLKIFEPNAPPFKERINSLIMATESGFSTTVSAEPLLDPDPSDLITKITPYLPDVDHEKDQGTIWIGLLKIQYIPLEKRKNKIKIEIKKDYNYSYSRNN